MPDSDTCAAATTLGTSAATPNNQKLTAMGYRAAWYRVRVTENDSSIGGLTLRVAAKLTSPSAIDFDVFVYLNAGSDAVECSATTGTVTSTGSSITVKAEWGESGDPERLGRQSERIDRGPAEVGRVHDVYTWRSRSRATGSEPLDRPAARRVDR